MNMRPRIYSNTVATPQTVFPTCLLASPKISVGVCWCIVCRLLICMIAVRSCRRVRGIK